MLYGLLTSTTDKFRNVPVGEAALYALLGFGVVFVGIAFLILVVWLVGKVMSNIKGPVKPKKNAEQEKPVVEPVNESIAVADASEEAVSDETVAVIMAALMAYYQQVNPKCEFTVKRIKKINRF